MRRRLATAFSLLVVVSMLATACGQNEAPRYEPPPRAEEPAVDIVGPWRLIEGTVDSAPVVEAPDLPITVVFTATTAGGSAGCNGYTATSTVSGSQITLSNFVITEIACDDQDAAIAEDRFLAGLRRIREVADDEGTLVLSGSGVELRLRPGRAGN